MTALVITDVTTGVIAGTGSFDKLMAAVTMHLEVQYQKNYIKGTDYANVYLASIVAVLQQSVQWELGKQAADKQAELLAQQKLLVVQETANAVTQNNQILKQTLLIEAQDLQVERQTANLLLEADNIPKQGLVLDAQEDQLLAEIKLVTQKYYTEQAQTRDVMDTTFVPSATTVAGILGEQAALINAQELQVDAETDLVAQQKITEKAQTLDNPGNPGVSVLEGTLAAQHAVHTNQAAGFLRDAEQQAAKILSDLYSVVYTATPASLKLTDILGDTSTPDSNNPALYLRQVLADLKTSAFPP